MMCTGSYSLKYGDDGQHVVNFRHSAVTDISSELLVDAGVCLLLLIADDDLCVYCFLK